MLNSIRKSTQVAAEVAALEGGLLATMDADDDMTPAAHRKCIKDARKGKKGRPPMKKPAAATSVANGTSSSQAKQTSSSSSTSWTSPDGWNGNTFRLGDVLVIRKVERGCEPFFQLKNNLTKKSILQVRGALN